MGGYSYSLKNESERRIRLCEGALLMAMCAALLVGTWAEARSRALSAGLVRLHVVAASDDEYEQELKLRVRDAVIEYLTPVLDGARDSDTARRRISENLNGIARAAAEISEGREIRVTLGREDYPTRRYAAFALPAGQYESLSVEIGAGEGHNWWCVVFPPLCAPGAPADELRAAMKSDDYALITQSDKGGEYELRFRTLELWGELTGLLSGD